MNSRLLIVACLVCSQLLSFSLKAQEKSEPEPSLQAVRKEYGARKTIPPEWEEEILTALSHFPLLKQNKIDFVLRNSGAPMSSRPVFGGILRSASKRKYKIFINRLGGMGIDSNWKHEPPPRKGLIGLLGHELSHVESFAGMSGLGLLGVGWKHLSRSKMNKFEFLTDSVCIERGLGEELLVMGIWFRGAFGFSDPEERGLPGKKSDYAQRYMGPATIRLYMAEKEARDLKHVGGQEPN